MILLWSFEDVINTIGMVTDGIVEKVGGNANLESLLTNTKNSYEAQMPGMFKFQQMLRYILGLGCYMISLLGYYLTEVSINFVYTILYILRPLLILAFLVFGEGSEDKTPQQIAKEEGIKAATIRVAKKRALETIGKMLRFVTLSD